MSSLAPRMPQILAGTRRELIRDAVRRGWLHHVHRDRRTTEGDRLAERVRIFQRRLRNYASDQGEHAFAGSLLPYAMRFGMAGHQDTPLLRFARAWVASFSALPGWHPPMPTAPDPLNDPVPLDNRWSGYSHW
jgi:hypothetical protein